jgi:hypothetical protein
VINNNVGQGGAGCGGKLSAGDGTNVADNPDFTGFSDPDRADDTWATCDDGLIPTNEDVINNGDNEAIEGIETDIKGSDRIIDGDVDMGAYEYDPGC